MTLSTRWQSLERDGESTDSLNAILPSIIDTPPNRASMPEADFSRWVAPSALAEIILFLASDAARAITGAAIAVNGRV